LKLAGVSVFGATASIKSAFDEGVPGTASRAFAQPAWRGATAIGASENGFVFGHVASLTL
jgi:hypothetical protein